ncbi:potassium channel family protein [Catenulispora pinisilvae]|uniref:potassium channel family protein n=1 Tax=Catenulispora pinisilvae TaxID=2705253 RepID=UPI002B26E43C|nr:NAD-binding protein [Catenulispora pinisilvae]
MPVTPAGGADGRVCSVDQSRSLLRIPRRVHPPLTTITWRLALALGIVVLGAVVVWLGRDGYRDSTGRPVGWLTAFYYSTVTLTTIGYGDVVPVSDTARLVNTLVITPLRLSFLLILVGTTLRALTERTRAQWREQKWRHKVRAHALVIGYGTKGRAAVDALLFRGWRPRDVVVVDVDREAVQDANRVGLVGVVGDGTRTAVLDRAEVRKAAQVMVTTGRDDTAVLAVLTVRRMHKRVPITASVKQTENAPLLRDGGADVVITSSEVAGQLVGTAAVNPTVGIVMEDMLSGGLDLRVLERDPAPAEVGLVPQQVREAVMAVVRDGKPVLYDDPGLGVIRSGDQLVVLRSTPPEPPAQVHRRRLRRPRFTGDPGDDQRD